MKTLGLITARGGSKRIPNKNIKIFNGKPLIQWTIEAAKKSNCIDHLIVSTDSHVIADISRKLGAEVPFIRPNKLSGDKATSFETALHAMNFFKNAESLVLLQPTSPLRSYIDIRNAFKIVKDKCANSAATVSEVNQSPHHIFSLDNDTCLMKSLFASKIKKDTRSQDLPKYYSLNGAFYFSTREELIKKNALVHQNTIGIMMPLERSIDIDTYFDWKIAEMFASNIES